MNLWIQNLCLLCKESSETNLGLISATLSRSVFVPP